MRNVQQIIDTFGGLEALKHRPIRLEVPGFMRLVIEHVGTGPRSGELVSVAHYGEQNGDLMRDPEIVFEVAADQWQPVSIQQDYIGSYREAVFVGENGKVFVRPAEVRDIASFACFWDRNLKHQGFVDAAKTAPRSFDKAIQTGEWFAPARLFFGDTMKGDDNERVYNGKLYTLRHCFDPWTGRIERGWVGYCGPDRVGWFRTKADFWRHVELIECIQLDAACVHALDVERQAAIEGAKLLDRLHLWNGSQRNKP